MKVLIACEFSGIVREAFKAKGHDAWSCDLLPTEIEGQHLQCDVRDVINRDWDLMIAHPPCTYLANSGVQHMYIKKKVQNGVCAERWEKMMESLDFFSTLFEAPINKICIENPVPHSFAKKYLIKEYDQIVQPFYFGEEKQKKTCLWLKNLPLLKPTKIVGRGEQYFTKNGKKNGSVWYQLPPSQDRWRHRSKTFQSIANAMAEQWGSC